MPAGYLNRALWAAMLVAMLVLGWQYRDAYLNSQGVLEVIADGPRDTLVLAWSGKIAPPMREKISAALAEHGAGRRTVVLSLNSPGGLLGYGDSVNALLREIAANHRLETTVEAGHACASMCVPIYLQGQVRTAAPRARFMFHEVSQVDLLRAERVETSSSERTASTDRFLARYFKGAGVSDAWLADVRPKMTGQDYWRTAEQLVEEKAGIVQTLR